MTESWKKFATLPRYRLGLESTTGHLTLLLKYEAPVRRITSCLFPLTATEKRPSSSQLCTWTDRCMLSIGRCIGWSTSFVTMAHRIFARLSTISPYMSTSAWTSWLFSCCVWPVLDLSSTNLWHGAEGRGPALFIRMVIA